MSGRRAALAAAATLLATDILLLATGIPSQHRLAEETRRILTSSVAGLPAELSSLQRRSDEARRSIFEAMDALDDVLNKARNADGIAVAQESFGRAAERMDAARRASAELGGLTETIISRASSGGGYAKRLERQVDASDVSYLEALEAALPIMIEASRVYEEMNAALAGGLKLYEDLFRRTDDFFKKVRSGFFRNKREAAAWLTLHTEDIVPKIQDFKTMLEAIEERARLAAERARDAFHRVEEAANK